jgi:hypothetical protein
MQRTLVTTVLYRQRISDFMRFTKEMIRYEKNKEGVLTVSLNLPRMKTDVPLTVAHIRKLLRYSSRETVIFQRHGPEI